MNIQPLSLLLVTMVLISVSGGEGEDAGDQAEDRTVQGQVQNNFKKYFSIMSQARQVRVRQTLLIEPVNQIGGLLLSQEIARDYAFNIVNLLFNYLGVLFTHILVQIIF